MGRPLKELDEDLIIWMAKRQCTHQEIADAVGCSPDTLTRRFADLLTRWRAVGKTRLRAMQWRRASRGSDSMLIHLGKQYLGQADKATISMDSEVFDPVEAYSKDPELMQEALELERKAYVASQAVDAGNAGATDLPGVAVPTPHSETRRVRDGTIEQPEGEPGDCPDTSKAR